MCSSVRATQIGWLLAAAFSLLLGSCAAKSVGVDSPVSENQRATWIKSLEGIFKDWSVVGAALFAIGGHLLQMYMNAREEKRKWKISRMSRQIEEFYGPLRASLYSSKVSFNSMLKSYVQMAGIESDSGLAAAFFNELHGCEEKYNPESKAFKIWTKFITEVAIPNNTAVVEVLTTKSHLYEHPWPDEFFALLAHSTEVKMLAFRWGMGDFSQLTFTQDYPDSMHTLVNDDLDKLKSTMVSLLGVKESPTQAYAAGSTKASHLRYSDDTKGRGPSYQELPESA